MVTNGRSTGGHGRSNNQRRAAWPWVAGLIVALSMGGGATAFQEKDAVGLTGILPTMVPTGLTLEDFSVLGENWQPWNEQTSELLFKLYEPEQPLDVAGQKAVLAELRERMKVMQKSLADDKYSVIHDPLTALYGRLNRRISLAEAILKTLEADGPALRAQRLEGARTGVLAALDSLETYLKGVPNGAAWLPWVRADELRRMFSDPAQVEAALPLLKAAAPLMEKKREALDPAQRAFVSKPQFLALGAAIQRVLTVPPPPGPETTRALREQLGELVAAIERYEEQNLAGDASALRDALNRVRLTAPDGGDALELVVRLNYMNFNLQALISEELMARMVSDEKCDFRPVVDYGLGAHIRGSQTTRTSAGFDLKPSNDGAAFQITVRGQTHSNTSGTTPQATVWSVGNHTWYANKSGHFDGARFSAEPVYVSANPHVTPVAASTNYDWIPIFGGIARGIAMDQARQRSGEAHAFAARRLIERSSEQIDSQVNQSLADASHDIQTDTIPRLKNAGLYSPVTKVLSTEDIMRVSSRVGSGDEPAGASPEESVAPGKGAVVYLHESLLNNMANRWGFAGRTMTERQVREELQAYFTQLLNKKVDLMKDYNPNAEGPNIYVFDKKDPIRFQLRGGAVHLIIRAAFREEGKEDIPAQVVTVPLSPRVERENIVIERGQVTVAPVEKPDALAVQLIRAGIIRKKIEQSFPTKTQTRRIEVKRTDKPSIDLWVMRIKLVNGWMTVRAE